jgi:hypothetical protein
MPHIVRQADERKAEAFIAGAATTATAPSEPDRLVVTMRFDSDLLARVDAAARRQGISRTAWLHVAASQALER